MRHCRAKTLAFVLGATCLTQPAFAQQAEPTGLEEIVVTARKSSENLQQVPLAITAVSAATLEKSNAREIRDIALLTPGLNIAGDGSERAQQPSIRGLSFSGGDEGNVAVMLDGIYISNPGALSLGMVDFERVEVVKGPQSALYGHNAFGGAINYVPKAPPQELEAKAQFRLGNYDSHAITASIGGPLVDGIITARLTGMYDHTGGTFKDSVNKKQIGGYVKKDAALQVRITPNDWATFDVGLYYGNDVFNRAAQVSFANNCAPTPAGALTQYCGALPSPKSLDIVASTYEPEDAVGNKRLVKHARIKSTFETGFGSIVLNLGHFNVKSRSFNDLFGVRDGLTFNLVGTPAGTVNTTGFFGGATNNKDYEAELRFASNQDQPLRWGFGAYFYKTKAEIITDVGFNQDVIPDGRTINCPSNFACMWLTPGGNRYEHPGLAYSDNKQASIFGSLAYDVSEKLTVQAEARYTYEKKKSNVISVVTAPVGTGDPDGDGQSATFKFWNPRFTANYQITPDNLIYASAAKGTKSGGFNQRAILVDEQVYNPESNWTYEIGFKNSFFDRRVRLNVAAFYVDWTNLQILVPSALITNIGPVTQNYGSVKAKGGEIELQAKVSDGISVNGGVAYTDPKFGSDSYDYSNAVLCSRVPSCASRVVTDAPSPRGPVTAVSLDGLLRSSVSRWQYTAGVNIDKPLTEDWKWFATANYKYESKQYTQIDDLRYTPARNTLGLQLGVQGDHTRLAFYVQNALNDLTPYAAAGGTGITRYNNLQQFPKMSVPDKRRMGVTLDYTF